MSMKTWKKIAIVAAVVAGILAALWFYGKQYLYQLWNMVTGRATTFVSRAAVLVYGAPVAFTTATSIPMGTALTASSTNGIYKYQRVKYDPLVADAAKIAAFKAGLVADLVTAINAVDAGVVIADYVKVTWNENNDGTITDMAIGVVVHTTSVATIKTPTLVLAALATVTWWSDFASLLQFGTPTAYKLT
jgi:hypothetical protein